MVTIEINKNEDVKQNGVFLKKKRKLPEGKKKNNKPRRKMGKEYYTLYKDIDEQMKVAQDAYEFQDKVVLCNCDNPLESNFFSYFVKNFHKLGLQKLICTCYKKNGNGLKIEIDRNNFATIFGKDFQSKNEEEKDAVIARFREQENGELCYIQEMKGDGNCLGEESLENLKKSDIVVTNPPFGKIATQLISKITEAGKKFILICELHDILGHKNNNLYNEKKHNIDFGPNSRKDMQFNTPKENSTLAKMERKVVHGAKWINNIGLEKYDYEEEKCESKDRVREILNIENAYAIPDSRNLKYMIEDIKEVYDKNKNALCGVSPYMFYSNNCLFNNKNFNVICVSDELGQLKDNRQNHQRSFPQVERKANSPERPSLKSKKLGKDKDDRLFYFYDIRNIICKKNNDVDLDKIKKDYETLNLANITKPRSFTTKK